MFLYIINFSNKLVKFTILSRKYSNVQREETASARIERRCSYFLPVVHRKCFTGGICKCLKDSGNQVFVFDAWKIWAADRKNVLKKCWLGCRLFIKQESEVLL